MKRGGLIGLINNESAMKHNLGYDIIIMILRYENT